MLSVNSFAAELISGVDAAVQARTEWGWKQFFCGNGWEWNGNSAGMGVISVPVQSYSTEPVTGADLVGQEANCPTALVLLVCLSARSATAHSSTAIYDTSHRQHIYWSVRNAVSISL